MIKQIFGRRPPRDLKKEIIWQALRFVLEPDEKRFRKTLMAQLLDEGCNYPVFLAQPLFYHQTIAGLGDRLGSRVHERLSKSLPEKWSTDDHASFYRAILFLRKKLKKAEEQLALQVLDSLEAIRRAWLRPPDFFYQTGEKFEKELKRVVGEIIRANPGGHMAQWSLKELRRRLHLGLTASLMRHLRSVSDFEREFGPTDLIFAALDTDHELFGRIMLYYQNEIPQFTHTASQIFWRMLMVMDAEA